MIKTEQYYIFKFTAHRHAMQAQDELEASHSVRIINLPPEIGLPCWFGLRLEEELPDAYRCLLQNAIPVVEVYRVEQTGLKREFTLISKDSLASMAQK